MSFHSTAVTAVLVLCLGAAAAAACSGTRLDEGVAGAPICAPQDPRRVATLDPFYSFQMAATLGLPVVATTRSRASLPGVIVDAVGAERMAGIESLGQFQEPDLERLIAVEPDLILGDAFMHGDYLPQLSQVAPTVLVDRADWKAYLRTIAQAGGVGEEAESQLAAYEAEVASLRAAIPPGTTVSFLRIIPGGFQVYVDGPAAYAPMRVMAEAGLSRPSFETVTDDTVLKRPSMEGLLALTGDVLIYTVGGGHDSTGSDALMDEVAAHPVWQAIPAVAAGRAHRVDADVWMAFGGLHSARAILADLRRIFVPG